MFGEKFRFWLPVVLLVGVSGYTGQKLVRAHFYEMPTPNYDYEKEDVSMRGSVYDSTYIDSINSRPYPLVKSTSRWAFRLDPVAMTAAVVRVSSKEKPRPMKAQARTIANVLKMDYNAMQVSRFYKPRPVIRDAYIPVSHYIDNGFFSDYKTMEEAESSATNIPCSLF